MSGSPLFTSFLALYFLILDINVTHSTCVDAKALLPILIEEYSLFVSTIEVGGETVEFKKETEKYSYRIPYSQEDAETEDTDL
jgi:hypothetical protein